MATKILTRARVVKDDEFYTRMEDIEKELQHYSKHFNDKVVYCNCDNPEWSNFWKYFSLNFERLGLKRLFSTHFSDHSYLLEMWKDKDGMKTNKIILSGNGDFRSVECIEILKKSDIVVTNPPFSLLREYVTQLIEYNKKFLIVANINAVSYRSVFFLIKSNQLWLGNNSGSMSFRVPNVADEGVELSNTKEQGESLKHFGNICWFTNMDFDRRHKPLVLSKKYNEEDYSQYDNYSAISVNKVVDIPMDYTGEMGVPMTILEKFNSNQFEIVGTSADLAEKVVLENGKKGSGRFYVNGKRLYGRIVVRYTQNWIENHPEVFGKN